MLKALAIDLYRAQQRVHQLEEQLENAPLSEKEAIKRELRGANAECNQLRRLVEAKKQKPLYRTSHKKTPGT
ncbi:MAG: hypothetical protein KJO60_00900 [Desulfofustis sp.]|nr:hypothetical protein [Desulfofustis sp.]MBT8353045.1 hypothetical protein [Desulfofustis sp.]NNF45986.1 hypothetical protein [Desulfofustis sp.]NNK58050.1 hypothetical protein [Desulfofustis sp.]